MNKKQYSLGIILAALTGAVLAGILIVRALFPRIILPRFDLSLVLIISLISLVIDHYFVRGANRNYISLPIFGAVIFGGFPLAALLVLPLEALKSALIGALALTVTTILYDSIVDRLSKAPIAKAAPIISALGLYLASQCVIGIF